MEQQTKAAPKAMAATIQDGELRLTLPSGAALSIPAKLVRPLQNLSEEQLADVRVTGGGSMLLWPQGGASIMVDALLEAVTGLETLKSTQSKSEPARTDAKVVVPINGSRTRNTSVVRKPVV